MTAPAAPRAAAGAGARRPGAAWRFVAGLGLGLAGCGAEEPLQVLHAAPLGAQAVLPSAVEIQLDRAIVDPRLPDAGPRDLDLSLSPPADGELRFPTPASVALHFRAPLAPAQAYEVRLDSGLRSADGRAVLRRSHRFRFTTPVNRMVALQARKASGPHPEQGAIENLDLTDHLVVELAFPAAVADLERLLSVQGAPLAGGAPAPLAVKLSAAGGSTAAAIEVAPDPAWPAHTRILVTLAPGLRVALDGAGVEAPEEPQVLSAATYGPFRLVDGPDCAHCRPPPSLVIAFSTPVDCERLLPFLRLAPFHELRCLPPPAPTAVRLEPRPPLLQFTAYALRLRPGATDGFGQVLVEGAELRFETGDPAPHLGVSPAFIVVPGDVAPVLEETVLDGATLEVRGKRVAFAEAWALVRRGGVARQLMSHEPWEASRASAALGDEGVCRWDDRGGREVCTDVVAPGELAEELEIPGAAATALPVPGGTPVGRVPVALADVAPGAGSFAVLTERVLDGQGRRLGAPVLRLVNVTELGLTVRLSPSRLVALVTRLRDGSAVAGAEVEVWPLARDGELGSPVRARTGAEGTAVIPAGVLLSDGARTLHDRPVAVIARSGADEALLLSSFVAGGEPVSAPPAPLLVGVLYTDRRVYRAGDTVNYRWVARLAGTGMLTSPGPVPVRITNRRRGGPVLHEVELTSSAAGTAAGSFVLPAGASPGEYVLEGGSTAGALATDFRVAERGSSDVAAVIEARLGKGQIEATVRASYTFGAPAASLPVRWWAFGEPAAPLVSARFPGARFGLADGMRERRPVAQGTGRLDAQGELALRLAPPADVALPARVAIVAAVDDLAGGQAPARATVAVEPAAFHLGVLWPEEPPRASRSVSLRFVAVSADDAPIAGAAVRVGPLAADPEASCSGHTDAAGVFLCELAALPEGSHVLEAAATTPDGGRARLALPFVTAPASSRTLTLSLLADPATPDAVSAVIRGAAARGTALVTLEREDVLWHRVLPLAPDLQVSIPLAGHLRGARVRVTAYGPLSGAVAPVWAEDNAAIAIPLPDDGDRLVVRIATDREVYGPGQLTHVTVSVRDVRGSPAAAEVGLVAVAAQAGVGPPDLLRAMYPEVPPAVLDLETRRYLAGAAEPPVRAPAAAEISLTAPPEIAAAADPLATWVAALPTAADGRASHVFRAPEAAGAYRLWAVAAGDGPRLGVGDVAFTVEDSLAVRVLAPRFVRPGDEIELGVIVENRGAAAVEAGATIETPGDGRLVVPAIRERTEQVAPGKSARLSWPVSVRGAPGHARLTIVGRLGDTRRSVTIELPIEPATSGPPPAPTGAAVSSPAQAEGPKGIAVRRSYSGGAGRPIVSPVPAGALVRVELLVAAPEGMSGVRLVDPFPACLEPVVDAGAGAVRVQASVRGTGARAQPPRGGRLTIVLETLARTRRDPARFTYLARAVTPGRCHAPPPFVEGATSLERLATGEAQDLVVLAPNASPARAKAVASP